MWIVDGWGFSLAQAGVGKSDHSRLRGGGETDLFQMLCYEPATGAMARMLCSRMLESALMVTSRQALFSSASLRVWSLLLTAANRPDENDIAVAPIHTRRRAKTWSTSTTSTLPLPRSPQAWASRRMPRPPGTSCSHTRANKTPSRYRSDLHACRRAMSCWPRCLRRRIHMSRRCSSCARWCGILIALTCNCHELPDRRATRETDRVGSLKLCPQVSLCAP